MVSHLNITIRFEDGSLWATVDEYPGVFSTGDTFDELRESLEEGISLYLAEPGQPPPRVRLAELRPEPVATAASAELAVA